MSKERPTTGTDGRALPILPPERDARVWARLVRVMFYTPGFLAILLLKTGEPAGFGITVELLMLSSAAAVVGGLFIGTQSDGSGRRSLVQDRHLERVAGHRAARGGAFPLRGAGAVPSAREQHAAARPGARRRQRHAGRLRAAAGGGDPAVHALSARRLRHAALRRAEAGELGHQHRHPRPDHRRLCRQPPGRLRHWKGRWAGSWSWAWPSPCSTASSSSGRCRRTTTCAARRRK